MKNFQFYIWLIVMVMFSPIQVFASTDINLNCLEEVMVGNEFYCTVKLEPKETIMGVFANYEYDSMFTYHKTELGESWKNVTHSSKGFTIVNVDGIEKESDLVKIYFLVSNDAVPGTEYKFKLKDLQLSNGTIDMKLEDKESIIKVLSVKDVVKKIEVYNIDLELKDGITSYTVTIPNDVTSVDISAILQEDKYQFVDEYGPRTVENLKAGDNFFTLQIKKEDLVLLEYEICVHRSVEKTEELKENEEKITNPKTGSLSTKIVLLGVIVSFCILMINMKKGKV